MKLILKLEEALMFAFSVFLFARLHYAWWLYPLLLFAPDLSMLGYLGGTKLGAWTYNVIHHKGLALGIVIIGMALANPILQLAGVIMFGHSSMDRILGYGLKYSDSFQHTHLGMIGNLK